MSSSFNILYEDNHIIAVNKLHNKLIQKDITGDLPLDEIVKEYLKNNYNKKSEVFLGIVHRLDRPVSGAVVFAKTRNILSRLNKLLREGEIKKKYWAVVKKKPPKAEDKLVNYIIKNQRQNKSYCHDEPLSKSREAILEYRLIGKSDNYYLLEINLITGRHHQIRAQLAYIDCPIKGDLKYGFSRSNTNGGIHLHSREIKFVHPVKKKLISIIADPPAEDVLWKSFMKIL